LVSYRSLNFISNLAITYSAFGLTSISSLTSPLRPNQHLQNTNIITIAVVGDPSKREV